MPDETSQSQPPVQQINLPQSVPPGFMVKMLDSMPSFVTGLVGSFLGIALAVVIVLKIGGMDVAFARVVNAYAIGLEKQMTDMTMSSADLSASAKALTAAVDNLQGVVAAIKVQTDANTAEIAAMKDSVAKIGGALIGFEAKTKILDSRLSVMETWACDHEDKVGKTSEFGRTQCKRTIKQGRSP